jgi:hypothetical protein
MEFGLMRSLVALLLLLFGPSISFSQDSLDTRLPMTVADAHDRLLKLLPDSTLTKMRTGTEDDMVYYHFSLGLWMRNNWGLWKGNSGLSKFFNSVGVNNPDDMSGIILETFWCRLNNRPLLLPDRIQRVVRINEQTELNFAIVDSICPIDRSELRYRDAMEEVGPPYRYYVLGECKGSHHMWVYEKGKPLYKPNAAMLGDFASGKFHPKFMMIEPGELVPIDDSTVQH